MTKPVGCRRSSRVSFFFSDALDPGYIFVNIGVDSDISSHEVSHLDPLELVFADHGSDGHLLPDVVQRKGDRERYDRIFLQEPSCPQHE